MSELCNILLDCGEIVWQTIISLSTRLFTNSKNSGKTMDYSYQSAYLRHFRSLISLMSFS